MNEAAPAQPTSHQLERDSRGFLLCPHCKTVRLWMNFEKQGKALRWFHQCRSCEARFVDE